MPRRAPKYLLGAAFGAIATTLLIGSSALAADDDPVAELGQQTSRLWVVLGAVLVIFMQAGFALVETGFAQEKYGSPTSAGSYASAPAKRAPTPSDAHTTATRWKHGGDHRETCPE